MADPDPRRPRLVADGWRFGLTSAVVVLLSAAYGIAVQAVDPGQVGSLVFIVRLYFGTWIVYAVLYCGLTWAALHAADGATLGTWLVEDRSRRRRRRRTETIIGSGGPVAAVSFCAVAIIAVVSAALVPALREDPVVIPLAVVVVASSWALITIVYAVHYARENTASGGLTFHGDGIPPAFSDYWYLAVQVSTAYGSGGVAVTTRDMRRAVTGQVVVAFVFNTVLVALLVSLLITVIT